MVGAGTSRRGRPRQSPHVGRPGCRLAVRGGYGIGPRGDNYNLRNVLLADGIGAVVGATLGSPFPPAVYIGHPGWKSIGGRGGYSLATGICISLICFLGLAALLLAVIPLVAILPILVYIGVVITSQAFRESPPEHAPAVVLAIIPSIAVWGLGLVDNTLRAVGTTAEQVGMAKLGGVGIIYRGMQLLGGGAVLAGMMLGAIAAFIINRNFRMAAIYALGASLLSFFGIIHGEKLGWAQSWPVALGYVLLAALCALVALRQDVEQPTGQVAAPAAATR